MFTCAVVDGLASLWQAQRGINGNKIGSDMVYGIQYFLIG
jgi:hypothetical protein